MFSFPCFVLTGISSGINLFSVRSLVSACFFVPTLYMCAFFISKIPMDNIYRLIEAVSYGSLGVYLFHREIFWTVCTYIGGTFNIVTANVAVIPFIFVCGYLIQVIYDFLIRNIGLCEMVVLDYFGIDWEK